MALRQAIFDFGEPSVKLNFTEDDLDSGDQHTHYNSSELSINRASFRLVPVSGMYFDCVFSRTYIASDRLDAVLVSMTVLHKKTCWT